LVDANDSNLKKISRKRPLHSININAKEKILQRLKEISVDEYWWKGWIWMKEMRMNSGGTWTKILGGPNYIFYT